MMVTSMTLSTVASLGYNHATNERSSRSGLFFRDTHIQDDYHITAGERGKNGTSWNKKTDWKQ
jgi:hypothetical protein